MVDILPIITIRRDKRKRVIYVLAAIELPWLVDERLKQKKLISVVFEQRN